MHKAVVALAVLSLAIPAIPVMAADADRDAVVKTVTDAYINGVHVSLDGAAMRRGFHPAFTMLVLADGTLSPVTLDEWIGRMEKAAAANPNAAKPKITYDLPRVDVTGTVAQVQVELSRDGHHTFTDHLLLYKFPDGWKIVSKAFYAHPR